MFFVISQVFNLQSACSFHQNTHKSFLCTTVSKPPKPTYGTFSCGWTHMHLEAMHRVLKHVHTQAGRCAAQTKAYMHWCGLYKARWLTGSSKSIRKTWQSTSTTSQVGAAIVGCNCSLTSCSTDTDTVISALKMEDICTFSHLTYVYDNLKHHELQFSIH